MRKADALMYHHHAYSKYVCIRMRVSIGKKTKRMERNKGKETFKLEAVTNAYLVQQYVNTTTAIAR